MSVPARAIRGCSPQQHSFSFIPKDVRRQMVSLWAEHFERVEAREKKRIETALKKIELQVVNSQTDTFDWREHKDLLDLPLWRHQASEYDIQPAPEAAGETEVTVVSSEDIDQPTQWSEYGIACLHEALLEYSLKLLNSKGNAEEKSEILRWIWAPDIYCWTHVIENGRRKRVPIYQGHLPFTFVSCCRYYGTNPEQLREGLAHVLRPVLIALGMKSKIN